jgi:hypothetical protein
VSRSGGKQVGRQVGRYADTCFLMKTYFLSLNLARAGQAMFASNVSDLRQLSSFPLGP